MIIKYLFHFLGISLHWLMTNRTVTTRVKTTTTTTAIATPNASPTLRDPLSLSSSEIDAHSGPFRSSITTSSRHARSNSNWTPCSVTLSSLATQASTYSARTELLTLASPRSLPLNVTLSEFEPKHWNVSLTTPFFVKEQLHRLLTLSTMANVMSASLAPSFSF